jgi:SAM-dependent methyltransferase
MTLVPDNLSADQKRYLEIHEPRFQKVISLIGNHLTDTSEVKILDVGPSVLTEMIQNQFKDAEVESLGIKGDDRDGGHLPKGVTANIPHHEFDLNLTDKPEKWIQPGKFDLVVCAEVIEHLHTAPEHLLQFLKSLLKSEGILILQTPNAASLIKRITLMKGKNPYERIRLNNENPGHFREYTRTELQFLARDAGYIVEDVTTENYFRLLPVTWKVRAYRTLQYMLGKNWKDGITLVLRNH